MVIVELEPGADVRELLDDVKARVDAIDTFPVETEKPIISEVTNRRQVIDVAISGNTDEWSLKALGERVRDELTTIEGISQVQLVAARPYEVSIEVSEEALRRHNLTFDAIATAVRRSSLDLPGGRISTSSSEILLRTEGQAYTGRQFESLPLITQADGTRIMVGDVASVVDGFAQIAATARDHDLPVLLVIFPVGIAPANPVEYPYRDLHFQVGAEGKKNGFTVLDLTKTFSALEANGEEYLLPDLHPNVRGHAAAAKALTERLLSRHEELLGRPRRSGQEE